MGRVLEDDVVDAGLAVAGHRAERGAADLLPTPVRVDVGVDVRGAHCDGVGENV